MSESIATPNSSTSRDARAVLNVSALVMSAAAAGGSVYLSLGLGLKACPLCYYQRSFAMAALLVFTMLLWWNGVRSSGACLIVLPLAASGLGVAAFHVYLVQTGKLECPPGLFGWGDGPLQSLTVFVVLTCVCIAGVLSTGRAEVGSRSTKAVAAMLIGVGVSWICIASTPPLPPSFRTSRDEYRGFI